MAKKYDILFKDEHLIIVNKPAHTLTIPGRAGGNGDSLAEFLVREFGESFVVHRLDKQTSGVICFARTKEAHRNLSMQFQNRTVQKKYLVLVDGAMHQEEGEIDKGIAPHPVIAGKMAISPKGKKALTLYKVKERFRRLTLVEADIKTGRTHQIRIHFQSIGYPLVVDKLYGRNTELMLSAIKVRGFRQSKSKEARPLIDRSTLHAHTLTIKHPVSGEKMQFEAPLPKDFRAVLSQLRKWGKVI